MSAINDGGPAFPHPDYLAAGEHGMSMRDYFAAHADSDTVRLWMTGPICLQIGTAPDGSKYEFRGPVQYTPEQARYRYADAMLKAREAQS